MEDNKERMWIGFSSLKCGSNDFQDYFDDAKESRVKQVPKNQTSRIKSQRIKIQEQLSFKIQDSKTIKIKIQDSRFKIQEKLISRFKRRNREATVKTSQGKYFSKIQA